MEKRKLSTKEKALSLNFRTDVYGSFAETGAGQEVANNFFRAGAASGSVAKTMSAYDMTISDAIYGKCKKYVSRERLTGMMDYEYHQLTTMLENKASETNFFALATTVETINFHRTNKAHGWIGFKFQLNPLSPPNKCIIHVHLNDLDPLLQQQAIGVLGVNLMYACINFDGAENMIPSLIDDILSTRVDIDMFSLRGPDFLDIDNRLNSLLLVKYGLNPMAMFDETGHVMQPSESLYKKDILVLRGRFKPPTKLDIDMLDHGLEHFVSTEGVDKNNVLKCCELTIDNLSNDGELNPKDFLDRADLLNSLGYKVMISNCQQHYKLENYLSKYVNGKLMTIVGVHNLTKLFDEQYYKHLSGGIVYALGHLFPKHVTMLVYPSLDEEGQFIKAKDAKIPAHLCHLFDHFLKTGKIVDIGSFNKERLSINSDFIMEMIKSGDTDWEKFVPESIKDDIKKKSLFTDKNHEEAAFH